MSKLMAALGIVVGSISVVFALLESFGVDITKAQETSVAGVSGLLVLVLGVWFHPDVPIGAKDK